MSVQKISNEKHITSIRDAFASAFPATIAASIMMLIMNLIFGKSGASLGYYIAQWTGNTKNIISVVLVDGHATMYVTQNVLVDSWDYAFNVINNILLPVSNAAIMFMGGFVVFGVGYYIAKKRDCPQPFIVAIVSFGCFMAAGGLYDPTAAGGLAPSVKYIGVSGIFSALVISLIFSELFIKLNNIKCLKIKMPKQVPPAVAEGLGSLVPGFLAVAIALLCNAIVYAPTYVTYSSAEMIANGTSQPAWTLVSLIYEIIMKPLTGFISNNTAFELSYGVLYTFLVGLLWFFGIHGAAVLDGIFGPLWAVMWAENYSAYLNGVPASDLPFIFIYPFYISFTGWTNFSQIISGFLFSKRRQSREVLKIACVPSIFQIGEPLRFGYPMVMNFIFLIPQLFVDVIVILFSYWIFKMGLIGRPVLSAMGYMPAIIQAPLVSMDWKAIILVLVDMVIVIALYYPFYILENIIAKRNKEELVYSRMQLFFAKVFKKKRNQLVKAIIDDNEADEKSKQIQER